MKKRISLIIMAIILIFCIVGYYGIKDKEWEDNSNPNATTVDNIQTISEAIEEAKEETEEETESISGNSVLDENTKKE